MILEVNGGSHYTITGKLKGYDILRGMIINEAMPLRFVHNMDLFGTIGNRNKLAYIT